MCHVTVRVYTVCIIMLLLDNVQCTARGQKVLDALLNDLLKKGMSKASDVILTGCSGLYNIHCCEHNVHDLLCLQYTIVPLFSYNDEEEQ